MIEKAPMHKTAPHQFKPSAGKGQLISVAPMLDWTDRHCRYFMRLLSPHTLLYTEMVTTGAILFGDAARHLDYTAAEHPLALQLGGSDPAALMTAAQKGAAWGYDEINLNCGCPSDRVQQGKFGACLMKEPALVAACIGAMQKGVAGCDIPITIKCRIGVDDCDDLPFLRTFVTAVQDAGCKTLILHARKAWLSGLSPKENREIPPLRYDIAADIKRDFPDLRLILNGGIKTVQDAQHALLTFDGVMIGRAAYENPYILAELSHTLYGTPLPDRAAIARQMIPYITDQIAANPRHVHVQSITRHMLGLYAGQPRGRLYRRLLTEGAQHKSTSPALIEDVIAALSSPSV